MDEQNFHIRVYYNIGYGTDIPDLGIIEKYEDRGKIRKRDRMGSAYHSERYDIEMPTDIFGHLLSELINHKMIKKVTVSDKFTY